MTAVLPMPSSHTATSEVQNIGGFSMLPSHTMDAFSTSANFRNGHLNLDTFSPVNQNGSFEFDRVLKRGNVQKRVQKNRAWKTTWKSVRLVLRPNLVSVYKDEDEAELRASISLSDVTAVAAMKASKSKRENVFAIYTPSRNFYFQGKSAADTLDWVERLRSEAHVENLQEDIPLGSRDGEPDMHSLSDHEDEERASSPEPPLANLHITRNRGGTHTSISGRPRLLSQSHDFSGNEMTSYSDFSDTPAETGLPKEKTTMHKAPTGTSTARPEVNRNVSQMSGIDVSHDPERVVWHGYLYYLKTKSGVRQWKKLWVVLRPKNLTFYKNDQEYSAVLIIPMSHIINVAEIDPVSKSKKFCLQIIAEEKTYRFCAPDEGCLEKWLGAFKAMLYRQNETARKASVA